MPSPSSEETATFAVDLEGNAKEEARDQAAALDALLDKITGATDGLRAMQQAQRNLQAGSVVNVAVAKELRDKIAAQRATIAQAQESFISLGGSYDYAAKRAAAAKAQQVASAAAAASQVEAQRAAARAAAEHAQRLGALQAAATTASPQIGALIGRVKALQTVFGGGLMAAAIIGTAAAIIGLTVAIGAATIALVRYGVAQANARRAELLRLEGLTKLRHFMGGFSVGIARSADKADFLQQTIDRVSGSVALGRDKIAGYTEQLYKMGLRGGNLQAALEGVAITAAVQGDEQAQAFAQWAAGANLTGQSVRRLADDVKGRLGKIAKAQMLDLNVQIAKARENFDRLFSGLKIERLLEGISKVTELFSQSSATGRALKAIIEVIVQPLIDQIGIAGPIAKRFFQGIVLGVLGLTIVVLRLRNWWRRTFGDRDSLKGLDAAQLALWAGVGAAIAFGIVLGGLVLTAAAVAAPFIVFYKTLQQVEEWGRKAGQAVSDLIDSIQVAGKVAGEQLPAAIRAGILSGGGGVVSAITQVADNAIKAFRERMQIRSPSRIMMRDGFQLSAGVAGGVRMGQPAVRRAMVSLVSGSTRAANDNGRAVGRRFAFDAASMLDRAPAPAAPQQLRDGSQSSRPTVEIHELNYVSKGGSTRDDAQDLVNQLTDTLEGLAITLGARKAA